MSFLNEFVGSSYIPIVVHDGKFVCVLFKSRAKIYCDLGGHREENESCPEATCSREVMEESLNTFNVNPEGLRVFSGGYYCYFNVISNITLDNITAIYEKNKKIIYKSKLPKVWKETYKVDFFPLINIFYLLNDPKTHENIKNKKTNFLCQNILGREKYIFIRPLMFIKNAFINNFFQIKNKQVVTILPSKKIFIVKKNNSQENDELSNTITIIV